MPGDFNPQSRTARDIIFKANTAECLGSRCIEKPTREDQLDLNSRQRLEGLAVLAARDTRLLPTPTGGFVTSPPLQSAHNDSNDPSHSAPVPVDLENLYNEPNPNTAPLHERLRFHLATAADVAHSHAQMQFLASVLHASISMLRYEAETDAQTAMHRARIQRASLNMQLYLTNAGDGEEEQTSLDAAGTTSDTAAVGADSKSDLDTKAHAPPGQCIAPENPRQTRQRKQGRRLLQHRFYAWAALTKQQKRLQSKTANRIANQMIRSTGKPAMRVSSKPQQSVRPAFPATDARRLSKEADDYRVERGETGEGLVKRDRRRRPAPVARYSAGGQRWVVFRFYPPPTPCAGTRHINPPLRSGVFSPPLLETP